MTSVAPCAATEWQTRQPLWSPPVVFVPAMSTGLVAPRLIPSVAPPKQMVLGVQFAVEQKLVARLVPYEL